jgi:teichuronic acid biosynthesis glycosyltransferase TuaG
MKANSTSPLVSIITPVYNAAPWLRETLDSVRTQTLTDWEQIMVDDGSSDNSVAIAEAAAQQDVRFRLIRTPRNMGPSAARNLAIDAARGRFIAFLDADDLWLPEKLARSVAWITSRGYSFIYHDYRHMSHDGLRVGALIKTPEKLDWRTLHTRRGTGGCVSIVIDRKRIPVFRFPPIAPYRAEDFCLWAQIIRDGHIGHRLPADLARYRLSPKSRSANKLKGSINAWHLYREVSLLPIPLAAYWWLQYAWSALTLYHRARPRERRA